jgi:hypothetical protein
MQAKYVVGAVLGASLASGGVFAACFDYADDCVLLATCCPDGTLDCLSIGPDGGTDGSDGSTPDCSGDPSSTNAIDACGVFAQADAPAGGDGTMAMPFVKLADAIAAAQTAGKRVYACASKPFGEAVTISAGIEVYGGLDCTKGWAWSQSARSQLSGPADTVALTITSTAGGAMVEGFAITGASPSQMAMGGSSIAVVVDDVAATLDHCNVTASDAADGVAGQLPSGMAMKGQDAAAQGTAMGPTNACFAAAAGGVPGTTTCGGVDTSGGNGGNGGVTGMNSGFGADGVDGSPAGNSDHGTGANASNDCTDATKGKAGTAGNAGPGGSPTGDTLSLSGITNGDTTDGQSGTPGQGGGGGGGAKSGTFCQAGAQIVDGVGASGGGGGAGGCGGQGGGGGKAGGSSIAIVSLGTKLTLTSVTLAVGKGGKGGNGVLGQGGGASGLGAVGGAASGIAGSLPGCKGGDGGLGGAGGAGGGGRGGHAIGIAYAKAPATMPAIQMFTPGTAGNGGTPGSGAPATSNGASGNQGQCWDFSTNAACP